MRKELLNQQNPTRRLRWLSLLFALLLLPIGAWGQNITVAGYIADDNGDFSGVNITTGTVHFDAPTNTLTLSGAEINGEITYDGTSNLTIAFSGTNAVSTSETSAIQYTGSESDRPKLTFSSTNGTLTINGESIEGFSDVDFGSLNLASISAQGVYYDKEDLVMRGYGPTPSDLTITTETYYPIWIYDPSLSYTGYSHTQLRRDSTVTVGGGTVSFDGDHTITISNINFNYEGNALVVVGPSMPALTVDLVGQSTATSGCTVLSLWDTTALTFTTDEDSPGSITGYDIVSWIYSGNGQIAYENGLRAFYDADKPYQKTISTTGTYIKIGNTPVSATGDINTAEGTAYFDATSNTLTLTEATIGEQGAETSTDIQVLVDDLTIEISGTNSIYGNITYNGSNYQSSNIQINKASSAESASLTATNVNGFSGCTWGDGLYLSAHDGQGATIDVHYEHFEGEGGTMQSYYGEEIADVTFSTEETNAIWVAGNMSTGGEITGTGITGTVTYNDGVLTLNNASLSTSETIPLIVCNGDLTVELVGSDNTVYFNGDYSTYVLKNNGATGTLTFTGEGELNITSEFYEGTYKGLCDGFSTVNFNDNLGLFNRSGSKSIENITGDAPVFDINNAPSGYCYLQVNNGLLLNATYHYKITYVDSSIEGHDVEVDLPLDETNYNINNVTLSISDLAGPCTITAYAKLNGNTIGSNKAKLFSSNPSPFRLVYGADPVDLVLAPAIEESDGISITGIEANVTYNEETGKISSEALGSFGGPVGMSATEGKTAILNNYFTMDFEVVPPAPSVSLEAGSYLNTDNESITITGTGQANTTVKYKWDDGEAQTYTEAISVLTGTLKAWEEYAERGTTVTSDTTAVEYTVNTNIATLYVAPIADIAYTSSAVTPTVVVKETEDAEASRVAGTDSTISGYKQGETAVAAADLINVGTYTVVIAGTGSYGGTKEASFDIVQADITPVVSITGWDYGSYDATENAPSVTSNPGSGALTYQYKVKDADDETYVAWPESPNTIAAGTYTIKATVAATTNYNSGTGTKDFIIAKATPTITFAEESYSVTYGEDFVSPGSVGDWPVTPTASSNTSVATVSEGNITIVGVGTTTITVTYAGNDNYNSTTATYPLVVNAKDISGYQVTVDATQTYTYTGSAITPNVTVAPASGGDALVLDTDYTIEYTNNTNAATSDDTNAPTATVTGKGNYIGTASAKFNIGKADLAGVTIAAIDNQTYTGDSIKPGVTVTFNDKAVAATEYDIAYTNNVNVSSETSATVTLTAKGVNFTEGSTKTASFQIVAATATITAVASQETTYNGESQAVTATVDKGTAVITYFTSEANRTSNTEGTTDAPTNAGTSYVKVTQGNANYTSTAVDVTFTINPKALTDDMVTLSAESFPYNGETQEPTVTVSDGTAMTADDYTVTNNGGQAVGTYDVVVTGKGNYTGEVTRSFSIVNRTLEVGANGDVQFAAGQTWASFYTTTESLELPEGVMAYIVTAVSETSATLQAINYVPQNVPVFLENGSTETTDNASADGNLLQGTTAATAVSTISGTVYGLHNNKLMQVTSGSIPAGRAYLTVDVPAGGRELTMIRESDTTGIETLGVADVDSKDLWYDMAGRKLQSKPNKKGFYIQNGKKVFVNK